MAYENTRHPIANDCNRTIAIAHLPIATARWEASKMPCRVVHRVAPYHVASRRVASRHVAPRRVASCRVAS
eukprot:11196496-Lingulodinium_polyedra.AAC.1